MKTYNRALDFTVLALDSLRNGDGVLAARLMAKAVKQSDINSAISILEASNKHAFELQAKAKLASATKAPKSRIQAEFPLDGDDVEETMDTPAADETWDADVVAEFGEEDDPLADVTAEDDQEEEEAPAVAMAKVLSSMVRRSKK